jgi:hypothetical protein
MDLALGLQLPAWPAHFVSGNSEASYEFTWVNGQSCLVLNKARAAGMNQTLFPWRMFSEKFSSPRANAIFLKILSHFST